MHQSPKAAAQAVTDLAQRIGASQLTEQHGDELRPAGKAFGGTLSSVLLYEYGELGSGKVMEQLIKQACDLYDWVALLWAAFGEFPARNGSPTSIIGGHSSYFRLQEPVLDKSDTVGLEIGGYRWRTTASECRTPCSRVPFLILAYPTGTLTW